MPKTKSKSTKVTDAVRVLKLKIINGNPDQWSRWTDLTRQCQQITNMIWQVWMGWHLRNDSRNELIAWLEARKINKKKAGKCPVEAVSQKLAKEIYDSLKVSYPEVHNRVWGLLMSRVVSSIKTRKASSGSLPGWSAILLCHEAIPSFTKPLPILFDSRNAHPKGAIQFIDGKPTVQIRIARKSGKSDMENLVLAYRGKRCASQVATARKIASGEYEFCGSQLYRDSFDNKWYVALCYRQPTKIDQELDKKKSAVLFPSAFVPFRMTAHGELYDLQGDGKHIEQVRNRCFGARRAYAANYRFTESGRGHGRTRAIRLKGREKWARRWREFVKRVNNKVSFDAVRLCQKNRCGEMVLRVPEGKKRNNRNICKSEGRDQTSWEFFQLQTMLEQKCQAVGIVFRTVEFGKSVPEAA